jgi:hypothetical protein
VIRDCTYDEVMSRTYTQKEYRDALRELAADSDQYNNCRDVIRHAQNAALATAKKPKSKDSGGGGSSVAAPPAAATVRSGGRRGGAGAIGSPPAAKQLDSATKAERSAIERARTVAAGPVALDDARVDPAKVGRVPDVSQVSDLPTSLVVLLAALLAGALALAGLRLRRLVHARRA